MLNARNTKHAQQARDMSCRAEKAAEVGSLGSAAPLLVQHWTREALAWPLADPENGGELVNIAGARAYA